MNIKHVIVPILGVGLLFLSGCNTIEGMGKDVKTGGESLEDTAQDHKSKDQN